MIKNNICSNQSKIIINMIEWNNYIKKNYLNYNKKKLFERIQILIKQ